MSELPFQQIYGTEMEWPMSGRLNGSKSFEQINAASQGSVFTIDYLPEGVVSAGANKSGFLGNGARYYADVGGKIEYATPENTSIEGLVLSELTGERIAAESLRRYIADSDKIAEVIMTKRVVDDYKKTWGYHINISEDRTKIVDIVDDTKAVVAHLATSQAMLGAGAVYQNSLSKEYGYSFGQKVLAPIIYDYRIGTQNEVKPFINLRDEPWADNEKFWRVHLVGVDPHISTWATRMSVGTIGLMLAASRQGRTEGLAVAGNNEPASKLAVTASTDLEMKKLFEMQGGKRYTVLDIQSQCIEVADKVTDRTDEQDHILSEWKRAHQVLSNNPMKLMESDAIAKLALIRGNLARRKADKLDKISKQVDLDYTVLFRATKEQANELTTDEIFEKSLAVKVRKKYSDSYTPSVNEIHAAMIDGPKTTRAYERGNAIKKGVASVNWDYYQDNYGNRIKMEDALADPNVTIEQNLG